MKFITKLVLLLLVIALVPFLVMGVLAFRGSAQSLKQAEIEKLHAINFLKLKQVDRWLDGIGEEIELLAQRPLVLELMTTLSVPQSSEDAKNLALQTLLDDHLNPYLVLQDGITEVFILDQRDGAILAATNLRDIGKYRENRGYFLEGLNKTYISEPEYEISDESINLYISTPLTNKSGETIGVIVGKIDLEQLKDIVQIISFSSPTVDTYLINKSNFFLTDPRFLSDAVLTRTTQSDAVVKCLQGEKGALEYSGYQDSPVLGVYEWSFERNFCIITEINLEEVFAPVNDLQMAIIQIGLAVCLGIILASMFFSNALTRSLNQLVVGVKKIGQGDLNYRVDLQTSDQIGELGRAYNLMAENLQHSLAQTAYSNQLLLTLSEAAKAIQLAKTQEEVIAIIEEKIRSLDYVSIIVYFTEDKKNLIVKHISVDPKKLNRAQRLLNLDKSDILIPVAPNSHPEKMLINRETVFDDNVVEGILHSLPRISLPIAKKVAQLLGFERAIYAPIIIKDDVVGVFEVFGKGIREEDVSAISTFAHQISASLEMLQLYDESVSWGRELEKRVAARTEELAKSESVYRLLTEASKDSIFMIDNKGRVQYINTFGANYIGETPENIIGNPIMEYYVSPEFNDSIAQVFETKEVQIAEFEISLAQKNVWFHTQLIPLSESEGMVTSALGVSRDLTERNLIDLQIKELAERLELAATSAKIGIWDYHVPTNTLVWDDIMYELYGISKDDFGGAYEAWVAGLHPLDEERAVRENQAALQSDQSAFHTTFRVLWPSGEVRYIEAHARVVRNDADEPLRMVGVNWDVTEIMVTHNKLTQQTKELAQSNKDLEQFAYVASHDLQEPLRMVASYLQLLERRYSNILDDNARKYIWFAVDGANRMKLLINALLDFSRIGTNQKPFKNINLNTVLTRVLSDLQLALEETDGVITLDELPEVVGDEIQLEKVFQNMITNAIKFRGDSPPEIHIGVEDLDDEWMFFVKDNGIGIAPEYHQRIFEIFKRLHAASEYSGTGIGLSIVKKVIDRHKGRIWIESEVGKGTKVCFTLLKKWNPLEDENNIESQGG